MTAQANATLTVPHSVISVTESLYPTVVHVDNTVTVDATVTNGGNDQLSDVTVSNAQAGDLSCYDYSTSSYETVITLAPGQSSQCTGSFQATSGTGSLVPISLLANATDALGMNVQSTAVSPYRDHPSEHHCFRSDNSHYSQLWSNDDR